METMSIEVRNIQTTEGQSASCGPDSGVHPCTFYSDLLWRINRESHGTRNRQCIRRGLMEDRIKIEKFS